MNKLVFWKNAYFLILFGKILPAIVRKMLKTPRSCINILVLEAMQTASAILC